MQEGEGRGDEAGTVLGEHLVALVLPDNKLQGGGGLGAEDGGAMILYFLSVCPSGIIFQVIFFAFVPSITVGIQINFIGLDNAKLELRELNWGDY